FPDTAPENPRAAHDLVHHGVAALGQTEQHRIETTGTRAREDVDFDATERLGLREHFAVALRAFGPAAGRAGDSEGVGVAGPPEQVDLGNGSPDPYRQTDTATHRQRQAQRPSWS